MDRYISIFIFAACALLAACSREDGEADVSGDGRVCLTASVEAGAPASVKSITGDGEVVTGDYHLVYYSAPDTKSICEVSFTGSTGYPLVEDSGAFRFLRWSDLSPRSSDNSYFFSLDNLPDGTETGTVALGDEYSAASVEDGSVPDIVWGSRTVASGSGNGTVDFSLYHRMSKISVEISVNSDGIDLDGKTVTVTLKNVKTASESFNRASGTVSAGGDYGDVILYEGVLTQNGSTYGFPSWIFPPQTFSDEAWPRLGIEFDGNTYEGPLNRYMVDEGDTDTPVEMTGLDAGRHLTLRARLSGTADDVEIVFMPVYIRKWEEVDNIGITAKQRGVYTVADYSSLVSAYNEDPKDEAVLNKFGTVDDESGTWTFVLYRDIGDETGAAAMPLFKDDAFVMDFNGYTVYGFSDKADLVEKPDTGGEDPDGGDGGSGSGTEGSGEDQSGSGQPGNIE